MMMANILLFAKNNGRSLMDSRIRINLNIL